MKTMSSLSDLLNTSCEETVSGNNNLQHRRRKRERRFNPMEELNDEEFRARYRIPKPAIDLLAERLKPQLSPYPLRKTAMTVKEQILLTISFFATGAFQGTVADNIRVHKTTACRIIQKVTKAIAGLRPHFIKMPGTEEEINDIKDEFYNIASFPNVVGALDCTHVKIQSPGGANAEIFRNRKGYFSLNVQCICDARLKIMDVICRWPGSVHNATIFNDSHLRAHFESGLYGNSYLLGDGGYPCRSYLLTPFINPSTPSEQAYNSAQILTRNTVQRCFRVLKRRFPCLAMGLRVKIDTTMCIIVACCILHNIAVDFNDTLEDVDEDYEELNDEPMQPTTATNTYEDTSVRESLLLTHFNC